MKNFALAAAAVVALLSPLAWAATRADAATPGPWKTEPQAAQYLETQLPSWAGINLHPPDTIDEDGLVWQGAKPSAYCSNGYYAKREQRTGRHYGQRVDRNGEDRFRTFSCSLYFDGRDFNLYVQTRRGKPWVVTVDR